MSDWPEVQVGDICTFAGGYAFPHKFQGRAAGDYPFFKVSDMNASGNEREMTAAANWISEDDLVALRAKAAAPGTVVFPKVGAALKTEKRRILRVAGVFDNNVMGLVPGPRVLPEYLLAAMETVRLGDIAQEGVVPSVNQAQVGAIRIPLPSVDEQRRITDLLQAVDRVLGARRAQVLTMGELLAATTDELVRRAAATTQVALGDVAIVERGYTWKKKDESPSPTDGALPVVRIGNVQPGGIDMSDRLWIRNVDPKKVATKFVSDDTILVVGSNGNPDRVGNAYLADPATKDHLYASFLIGVTPTALSPRFLWRYLQSRTIQRMITAAASGSTGLRNIGLTWLRALQVPRPTSDECDAWIAPVEAVDQARLRAVDALRAAERFRGALLWSLLSGAHQISATYDERFFADDALAMTGDLAAA